MMLVSHEVSIGSQGLECSLYFQLLGLKAVSSLLEEAAAEAVQQETLGIRALFVQS